MKKVTLLCGMLLALTASIASAAQGTNLRWSACFGDGGPLNRSSTCLSNNGSNVLVGSFEMGASLTQVSGVEIVIDIGTAGVSLPAWWSMFNVGTCRPASLTSNAAIAATAANCFDWANNFAQGGLAAYNMGFDGPNTARTVNGFAVSALHLANLDPATEYFCVNMSINNASTVGTGSCSGCSVPACIVFNSVKVATPPVAGQPSRDVVVSGPTNGTDSYYCTWQGGIGIVVGGKVGCPAAVPTHGSTWSQVKTLYR